MEEVSFIQGESVPCSIATALAIEGAFGIHPDNPLDYKPIDDYTCIYINLDTLIRNAWGALETGVDPESVPPEVVQSQVESDYDIITGWIADKLTKPISIVIYQNHFDVKERYPEAIAKLPTTEKQRAQERRHGQVKLLLQDTHRFTINTYTGRIQSTGNLIPDALIITHRVFDLFSRHNFKTLSLLESHTGKVKRFSEFGSKLTIKDTTLPFNIFTLCVFGDNQDFSALTPRFKRVAVDMADMDRWTAKTTIARIKASIGKLPPGDVKDKFEKIIRYVA